MAQHSTDTGGFLPGIPSDVVLPTLHGCYMFPNCSLLAVCSVLFAVIAVIPGCCSVSPGSSGKVAVSLFTNFSILGNSRRTRDED